jgi:hypothetical protein
VLRRFEKEMTVQLRREAGDDDGGNILQRQRSRFRLTRNAASQLSVAATNRTLRRIYADDVVGHATSSILGTTICGDSAQWCFEDFQTTTYQGL